MHSARAAAPRSTISLTMPATSGRAQQSRAGATRRRASWRGSRARSRRWRRRPETAAARAPASLRAKLAATKTPRMLTRNTHSISQGQGSVCPVSMVSAGIGATSPPETMEADAEAAVWLMLFSRKPSAGAAAGAVHRAPEAEGQQPGGNRHVERPADLEPAIDVARRQHRADHKAGHDARAGSVRACRRVSAASWAIAVMSSD